MAIATLDDLVRGLAASQALTFAKNAGSGGVIAQPQSFWKVVGTPAAGATPPTGAGEKPTKATLGAMPFTAPGGTDTAYLAGLSCASDDALILALFDPLWHNSGLSGTSLVAQTVNSPALDRHTTGEGVEAFLEVYTALGASARTVAVSYTNQAGTAGRAGSASIAASTASGRLVPVTLQAGDTGVRSVESLTLSGSTGSVGDFGVTLGRRLGSVGVPDVSSGGQVGALEGGMPVVDNAALWLVTYGMTVSPGPFAGEVVVAKG